MSVNITLDTRYFRNVKKVELVPVIRPQEWKDTVPDISMGVGTPVTAIKPDTYEKLLFFTGWSQDATSGNNRNVFVAEIDDDLNVKNIRKIISPSDVGADGIPAVDVMFDDVNDEWILFLTRVVGYTYDIGYVTMDLDLQTIKTSYTSLISGVKDCGFTPIPLYNGRLVGFAVLSAYKNHIRLFDIENYTLRPLPSPTDRGVFTWHDIPDVTRATLYDGLTYITTEIGETKSNWNTRLIIGPQLPITTKIDNTNPDYIYLGGLMSMKPLTYCIDSGQLGHAGHPYISQIFKQPVIFFTWFRHWQKANTDPSVATRRFRHEIWAVVASKEYLDPLNWLPLTGVVYHQGQGFNKIFYNPGAKKLVLLVYIDLGTSTSATVTVYEMNDIVNYTYKVPTQFNITQSGNYRFVIDAPAPYFQVDVSTVSSAVVWAVLV